MSTLGKEICLGWIPCGLNGAHGMITQVIAPPLVGISFSKKFHDPYWSLPNAMVSLLLGLTINGGICGIEHVAERKGPSFGQYGTKQ